MNSKIILGLALVLSGGLPGCSRTAERPAPPANAALTTATSISDIHMLDAQNGWAETGGAVGNQCVLRTSDGGQTWRDFTPRRVPEAGELQGGVCFLDAHCAWLSTYDQQNHAPGLLRTTNGGQSWGWFKTPAFFHEAHFFNANHGVASEVDVGAGNAYYRFYQTQYGGAYWEPVSIVPPDADPNADVTPEMIHLCNLCGDTVAYQPPSEVIIAHGDLGDEEPKDAVRLSISTNLGKTWRDVKLPLPSEKYRQGLVVCGPPKFLDDKNGWLAAIVRENDGNTFAFKMLAFYSTQDGGLTWTPSPGILEAGSGDLGDQRQFDIVSATDIFVPGGPNLYVTHDGAKTWQTVKPNIDFAGGTSKRGVAQIDFVDASHGWAIIRDFANDSLAGHDLLYRTSDGGATWTELPLRIAPRLPEHKP